jgi:phosphate transport system substrate-binding protein
LKNLAAALLTVVTLAGLASAQVKVDPELPDYKPTEGISGSLKSIGSDTMNNEMTLWAEGFRRFYPNVKVEIEGKGSSRRWPRPNASH